MTDKIFKQCKRIWRNFYQAINGLLIMEYGISLEATCLDRDKLLIEVYAAHNLTIKLGTFTDQALW